MALSALELNTISKGLAAAAKVIDEIEPLLHRLNVLYDSDGGLKTTITQEGLDAVPSFSGLTKGQLDDGMYALTTGIKGAIAASYTALATLAARG